MAETKIYSQKAKTKNELNLVLIGAVIITIFFKTDFYDPFNSAKLIILLLVSGWTVGNLYLSYKQNPIKSTSRDLIIFVLVFGFIFTLFLSTVMTSQFVVALLGETQRRNGFLAYLGLAVVLLYLSRVMDFVNALKVYKIGIITGTIVSFYGVLQISGNDFIRWNNPYNSMIGTLGNPNFASALIALLLLCSLYGLLLKQLPKTYRYMSVVLVVFGMVSIVASNSRQGLFVLLFSLIFYISASTFIKNKKIGTITIFVASACAILVVLGMLQKGPLSTLIYKQSLSARGYYWRAGIEMFKEFPIFGVGVDRYGVFFKQFREVGYTLQYGYGLSSTNAHNTFIQIFATAGLFVGLFYVAITFYILYCGLKVIKKSDTENQRIVLGLLSVWIGFQAQSLISIDNIGVSIWGWLLGGTLIGIANNLGQEEKVFTISNRSPRSKKLVKINVLQPLISFVSIFLISLVVIPIYNMERNLFTLVNISNPAFPQNKELVSLKAEAIISNKLSDPFYKYRAIISLYEMGYTERAQKAFDILYLTDPKNPDFLNGQILFAADLNNINKVVSSRKLLSEVDPWNVQNYLELLLIYKSKGDLRNAILMRDKIVSIAPRSEIAAKAVEFLG